MIRSELIRMVHEENPTLSVEDIQRVIETIFDEIVDAMTCGERVELRGFGAFSVRRRPPRIGRNPRTGESVRVPAKFVPVFRAGKRLRERINRPEPNGS